jgi:hypothetical protein
MTGLFSAGILLIGCSSGTSTGGGSGGETGKGGSGGSIGAGGKSGSGGSSVGSGGTTASGGAASGGAVSGGTTGIPGSGGAGVGGSGGASSTGGRTFGSGGTIPTGGQTSATGGVYGSGGKTTGTGGSLPGAGGSNPGTGGAAPGAGGATGNGGAAVDAGSTLDCGAAAAVVTYPTLPGAAQSSLYTVTANGTSQFVEQLAKFSPEMQVHYAAFSVASGCTAAISVTAKQSFSSYTVSPKSQNITATKSGNSITFNSGPNYLILQFDSKELLFILIDQQESNPPQPGDANVTNLADLNVDNTGATLVTSKIQSAITAASGATKNILYIPPGRYKVGELSMKSNMTLYLAAGAILDGSSTTGDYAAAGPAVEDTTHGVLHMNNVTNANILGRGVIDGNGSVIRGTSNDTPAFKINVMRIDGSSKILIDGIFVRDPVFWNTLIYNSDQVTIRNYKVINRRPTTTTYNQEDGVDFDCSTNGNVYNAFIYSGDDSMSPKREQEGKQDTNTIVYEKVVAYSNSAATKIGTKTFGTTIDGVTFKDIDIVKAGRAMVIDANDTALITNTKWQDIRIEAADSTLVDLEEDNAPTWRTSPNTSIAKDTYFTNITASVNKPISIHGKSSSVTINGVHFSGFTVQGKAITSQNDSDATWSINQYVSNITFQ